MPHAQKLTRVLYAERTELILLPSFFERKLLLRFMYSVLGSVTDSVFFFCFFSGAFFSSLRGFSGSAVVVASFFLFLGFVFAIARSRFSEANIFCLKACVCGVSSARHALATSGAMSGMSWPCKHVARQVLCSLTTYVARASLGLRSFAGLQDSCKHGRKRYIEFMD